MNLRPIERLTLLTILALAACGDDGGNADDANDTGSDGPEPTTQGTPDPTTSASTTGEPTPTTDASVTADSGSDDAPTTGTPVDCTDQMILDLGLVDGSVSGGGATNTADGAGWASSVDATAGGIVEAPQNPWLYLRFTDQGLEQVDLDDLQALDSTDWDIAAKRFGLRLNGGVSGPSTVTAAAIEGETYEALDALPDDATLGSDAFYTEDCTLIDDGSGQGSPNYRLTPWWTYPGCVATTSIPFVIELADGSRLKFVVDSYYQSGQDTCNETGMMGMGSANFSWRWAFLE